MPACTGTRREESLRESSFRTNPPHSLGAPCRPCTRGLKQPAHSLNIVINIHRNDYKRFAELVKGEGKDSFQAAAVQYAGGRQEGTRPKAPPTKAPGRRCFGWSRALRESIPMTPPAGDGYPTSGGEALGIHTHATNPELFSLSLGAPLGGER